MHLTLCLRMLHCMLVCASYYHYGSLYVPGWDFPHLEVATKVCPHTSMLLWCGISPTQSPGSVAWSPPRVSASRLRWWDCPTLKDMRFRLRIRDFPSRRPNFAVGISPTWRMKLTCTVDGTTSTREHNKHTKLTMRQVKCPGVKSKHSEETINFKQNRG